MNYLFYDVETPNRYNDSICAIGWVLYQDSERISHAYQLIDPQAPFDAFNTRLHGVSAKDVCGAPTMGEYWKARLCDLMSDSIVIAHNAGFDMSVTAKALAAENIAMPDVKYMDSLPAFRALYPNERCKLSALASRFGFVYQEHNAGDDSMILAEVMCAACREKNFADFSALFRAAQAARNACRADDPDCQLLTYEDYLASIEQIIKSAKSKGVNLSEIHFAFHGNLQNPVIFRKNGLDTIVQSLGGTFHKGACRKVDYYVCFDDDVTNTVLNARSIAADSRYHLQIIDTQAFLRLIGYDDFEPDHAGPEEIRLRKHIEIEAKTREKEEALIEAQAQRKERKMKREADRKVFKPNRPVQPPKGRAILQLDADGNIISEYPTISAASSAIGVNSKSIRDVLSGKQKRAGGYFWKDVSCIAQEDTHKSE